MPDTLDDLSTTESMEMEGAAMLQRDEIAEVVPDQAAPLEPKPTASDSFQFFEARAAMNRLQAVDLDYADASANASAHKDLLESAKERLKARELTFLREYAEKGVPLGKNQAERDAALAQLLADDPQANELREQIEETRDSLRDSEDKTLRAHLEHRRLTIWMEYETARLRNNAAFAPVTLEA